MSCFTEECAPESPHGEKKTSIYLLLQGASLQTGHQLKAWTPTSLPSIKCYLKYAVLPGSAALQNTVTIYVVKIVLWTEYSLVYALYKNIMP